MIKLFNKEHKAISVLTDIKDYSIEYQLSGENLTGFSLLMSDKNIKDVETEGYIQDKENEYVIKSIDPGGDYTTIKSIVNLETIKGKSIPVFELTNTNVGDTIQTAIAGTGWILNDHTLTKRRTIRLKNTNALEVLREIAKVFRVEYKFDAINKTITVSEKLGEDRGAYFTEELNLVSMYNPTSSNDYVTKLICVGKEGLTFADINNGKDYVENYKYSNKVLELIWSDERYTDKQSLLDDAKAKLEELSKPKQSYEITVVDLASRSSNYSYLDFSLGDTVTLLSSQHKFRDKLRVIKYIKYPEEPHRNTVELGNRLISFEDLQQENEYKNQVVDNITSDNGTIKEDAVPNISTEKIYDFDVNVGRVVNLTAINAEITNLKAQNVTINGNLTAITADIGKINVNVGNIDKLVVGNIAEINNLKSLKADIVDLNATNATIGTVEAEVGKIKTLVAGNLSGENIQAGGITSDKLTISNGFITNAMIANLDVSKVNAGEINTEKFRIKSSDGSMEFIGSTQQFKDKNNKVRIQLGKDAQGNFNFIIRGEDGTTTLIDHTGVKAKAIADDLIVSNMISSDAVGEKQINYSSFVTGFNKDTNTNTIKSTKVQLNSQNQTLDVAFNSLKTQADGTKSTTESNSTSISVMQGQITTAINNTQIVKDGQTVLLKDDYNRTVQTVNSMNSTLGSHTTKINEHTGKITGVESKVNTVERDLGSITQRVSSTERNVTTITSTANNALDNANNANKKIDGLEIGGNNIFVNTTFRQNSTNDSIGWDNSLNGTYAATNWVFYNGGVSNPTTGYHAHLFMFNNELVVRYMEQVGRWQSATYVIPTEIRTQFEKGKTYTYSFEIYSDTVNSNIFGGFYYYKVDGTTQKFHNGQYSFTVKEVNKWIRYIYTFTMPIDIDLSKNVSIYNYGDKSKGTTYARRFKLELGNKATDHSLNPKDLETYADNKSNDALNNAKNYVNGEITKTNNKVALIETTVNGITSKVESLESFKTTVDGKVTNLETWKREAEQKITDSAIISTVTSSHQWQNSSGGINLLPNPTARDNINGWADNGIGIIQRYVSHSSPVFSELHLIEPSGGGLSMLLKDSGGKVIFFDGGYHSNANHCIDYIKSLNITTIDYFIITHCHTDHAQCSPAIIDAFSVDNIIIKPLEKEKLPAVEWEWETPHTYDSIINKCEQKSVNILDPRINNVINISNDSYIQIFNSDSDNWDDYNHQSLMILYVYKNNKVLFAGDCTHYADISCKGQVGEVDIFQAGHHGDGTIGGSSQTLIDEIKPQHTFFSSDFLAVDSSIVDSIETLKRVSFWGGLTYSFGQGHNNNFKFILNGVGIESTTGKNTRANNVWYERNKGQWYWFKSNGQLAKNENITINGKVYNFDINGICTNP